MSGTRNVRRKSGLPLDAKYAELLAFRPSSLGQSYPQRCPPLGESRTGEAEPLGAPLSLREAARLIGCSPWTVRQKLITTLGLPVFRSGAGGKLIFYTNQVVRWIERQQGGRR